MKKQIVLEENKNRKVIQLPDGDIRIISKIKKEKIGILKEKEMEFYEKENEKRKKEFKKLYKPLSRKFMEKWKAECFEIINK